METVRQLGSAARGGGAVVAATAVSELRRDHGCLDRLHWCCHLSPGLAAVRLERRLAARDYTVRCRHPALRVLRHPEGHEVAWVLASGRVQIRVDLGIAAALREAAARSVWRDLCTCAAELTRSPAETEEGGRGA